MPKINPTETETRKARRMELEVTIVDGFFMEYDDERSGGFALDE